MYEHCVKLLLQLPALYLDTVDTVYGRTAAHWAVYYKRHDLLLQLIMTGQNTYYHVLQIIRSCMHGLSKYHLSQCHSIYIYTNQPVYLLHSLS